MKTWRNMKTWRDKLPGLVVGLVIAWIVWLFFIWYTAHYQPGVPRISL